MDSTTRLASAIRRLNAGRSDYIYGIWTGAESVDSDLSEVVIPGGGLGGANETLRFVPKGAHVTGLTNPSTVLLVGRPRCIVAVVVGDITLAEI